MIPHFKSLNLLDSLIHSLKEQNLTQPTEIQSEIIPLLLKEKSVVGISNTGSGKTLAYALPILHVLKKIELNGLPVTEAGQPRALIMVPTRELGEQVAKVFKTLTHSTRLRVRLTLGGMGMADSKKNVSDPFEILIATSDRLVQMAKGEFIDLSAIQFLIFDEADQMLDQGFLPNSEYIIKSCPQGIQMGLFTATTTAAVQSLIDLNFKEAIVVNKITGRKNSDRLVTKNITIKNGQRFPELEKLLKSKINGGTLIFTNTREQCDELAELIQSKGFKCGIYRGEMDPIIRKKTLQDFRAGKILHLVCTDLAARGLDIPQVKRVINYNLPRLMDNYVHRAGRTARGFDKGEVINFFTERDEKLRAELEGRKARPLKEVFEKSKLNFELEKEKQTQFQQKAKKANSAKTQRIQKAQEKTTLLKEKSSSKKDKHSPKPFKKSHPFSNSPLNKKRR